MISEKEKAELLYSKYTSKYGDEQGKKEAIKVAEQIHSLAPFKDGINMPNRLYWQKVIDIIKNK